MTIKDTGFSMTAVRIRQVIGYQTLLEQLMSKPSGVYLVTVHQRAITKIAAVDREINLQDARADKPAENAARKRRQRKEDVVAQETVADDSARPE